MSPGAGGAVPAIYTDEDKARRYEEKDPDDRRSRFARDHDRLVHTSAFRRLQGKTQVVTPGEADFFRTRLTHSIEVAQVARRLAEYLGADPDLCEASAILHDLGHPPFGHIGEEELNVGLDKVARAWGLDGVNEVGGYNGNAQSFRLAVKTLTQSSSFEGLDLTRGVIDGAVKYPYRRNEPGVPGSDGHWCFFPTESTEQEWVRRGVPAARIHKQSFEAQIVDWADDVAYSIHDVDDWYRGGFMPLEMLAQSNEFRDDFASRISRDLKSPAFTEVQVKQIAQDLFGGEYFRGFTRAYDGSANAKEAIRAMRRGLFTEFTRVAVENPKAPARRHENDLKIEARTKLHNRIVKQLLWYYVIDHPRMATHQTGQGRVVRELFTIHVRALAYDPAGKLKRR